MAGRRLETRRAQIQNDPIHLRCRHNAALIVHHANKNGKQPGRSRREDMLDVVLSLCIDLVAAD
jgi:hypothetical protein